MLFYAIISLILKNDISDSIFLSEKTFSASEVWLQDAFFHGGVQVSIGLWR